MLNNLIKAEKPIDLADIISNAIDQEHSVRIIIGNTELSGVITELIDNNMKIKCKEIDVSVIF